MGGEITSQNFGQLQDFEKGRSFSITLQMIAAGEWKWKWSNSVLKTEMGIFWCISITNNVKSYKKFDGKAQTAKFTVFARESQLRSDKNMED